jgi:hypothetical protein
MWQDYVMASLSFVLSVAAYRQVVYGFCKKEQKVTKYTAVSTAACLVVYTVTYYTLGLMYAGTVGASTTIAWALIAWQAFYYKEQK